MPSQSILERSSSPQRLNRKAKLSISSSGVSKSMANDDVLARLDALFQDVKKRREVDQRKRYSFLDKPDSRSKSPSVDRKDSTLERRSSSSGRSGSFEKRVTDRRRLSSSFDRSPNTNGYSESRVYSSLDRRVTTPRRGSESNDNRRNSASFKSPVEKRNSFTSNGSVGRLSSSPVGTNRKTSDNKTSVNRRSVGSDPRPGYRRDSLDVEKLTGNRRQSYYDYSIPEENNVPRAPSIRKSVHSPPTSVRFSPPPTGHPPHRHSPSRDSNRSTSPRASPARASPSRSTPLSFGRIRRHSDVAQGPLDCLFNHRNGSPHLRNSGDYSYRSSSKEPEGKPHFLAVTRLEDVQAIRCAEFHPSGQYYAVGSNSKTLRICAYPKLNDLRDDHSTYQPTVLFKRTKHHKGSIYCLGWSPDGELIATGSNDKTLKLMKFNQDSCTIEGEDFDLAMHDGTVRDVCFIEDSSNKSSLLISGGAGDCKIYVTDCVTGTPFQALSGHSGHVLSLHTWGGAMFVSGSQDRSVRFWDLRSGGCVNVITPGSTPTKSGSPVASICVDPSGRLLVSGHEDSFCCLYDIRGNRMIQSFRPHTSDVRSIRFSPSAYYLLTSGYDNKLVLTDLQGDLTLPLPSVVVAEHSDKAISGRWHPTDFSFISTSADKSCVLWALPPV